MIKNHGRTKSVMTIPGIHLKQAGVEDLPNIMSLFKDQLRRNPNEALIADALQDYPDRVVVEGKNDSGNGKFLGILFIAIGLSITAGSGISFLHNRNP